MENFIYNIPTLAYFGRGQIENLGEIIKTYGGDRVGTGYGGGDHCRRNP